MSNQDEYKIVLSNIASIYNKPSFSSELITQALIWENLIVCEQVDNWYKVKQRDGYKGWIHSFYLVDSSIYDDNQLLHNHKNWYWVKDKFVALSLRNSTNLLISFGSLIPCFREENQFVALLPNNNKVQINDNSLINFTNVGCRKNILEYAKQLIGTTYLWGGKSGFGFDCSGLVQTVFNTNGISVPRDSRYQYEMVKQRGIELEQAKTGDLLFLKKMIKFVM